MSENENEGREPSVEAFLAREPPPLKDWRWLWEGDHHFPIRSHRSLVGRVIVAGKRILRGLVRAPQGDLWERQRAYNLVIQEHLERGVEFRATMLDRLASSEEQLAKRLDALGSDLQSIQQELGRDLQLAQEAATRDMQAIQEDVRIVKDEIWDFLQSQHSRLEVLEGFHNEGWDEVMDHTAALFSRLDQKLDRYRQLTRERWDRLGGLLEVARQGGVQDLARAVEEEKYLEFEGLFRGREAEIGERLAPYLEVLSDRSPVLDLGCGRGEALELLAAHGITGRGVDSSSEMIERCRQKGFDAEVGDVFDVLARVEAGSLGAVVSFHVIEHLPVRSLDRLVRLSWRALRPGGVLVFETPSPLSLVVGARNFWIDPTHLRPVHPESLRAVFELNGFNPVERLDLQPFPAEKRLPEVDPGTLDGSASVLAEGVNELRDRLDELLFGFQDYGMIGYKPDRAAGGLK
jgi:O-antigen chain-terminating methyltransferase